MLFPHFISILRYLVVFSTLPSFGKCSALLNRLSCVSLRPVGGVMPADGENPFTVTASPSFYTPGTPIQITISAANGETFSGMVLQARVNGSVRPIGSFSPTNGFVNFDCGGDTFATLTDDGSSSTRTFPQVFTWNPPNFVIGRSITIYIVIVREGVFWWLKLRIQIAFQVECNAGMCQNGGTCEIVQPNDEVYCMCPPPFTGPLCTDCTTTPCDDSSGCPASASCIPGSNCNSYRCVSITGSECSTCGQEPCLNGGVCVHDTSLPYSFRCECPADLAGEICDTAVREMTDQVTYELTGELMNMVMNGNIFYILFDLEISANAHIKVMIDIQGFDFFFGKGMPGQNPTRLGLTLYFEVERGERISFWFCLKPIADVTFFQICIVFCLDLPPPEPEPYELPPDIRDLVDNGDNHCLVFTVTTLSKVRPIIQGYIFSYGLGELKENPQQQNLPLIVDAGDAFWICLTRVLNPGMAIFQLDYIELVAHLNLPAPLPEPQPFVLPPDILDLIDDGNEHYLAFTVSALSKIRPFIQGYNFSYGIGDPRENPQQQNLPLILDAGDTFCICLRRVLEVGNIQFDNRQLVVSDDHQVGPIRPQQNYQLPAGFLNMITNGGIDCIVCTVSVRTQVNVDTIRGFDFCYGTGVPIQNKQNNGPLDVAARSTFWFCLEPINPPFVFILDLHFFLDLPVPPPEPEPYELPPDIRDLVDNGDNHCLVFTVSTLSKIWPIIQGYIFSYGLGEPRENPQQQNLPLIVDAGDTFWICLTRVLNLGMAIFQLDYIELVAHMNLPVPLPAPAPAQPFVLPPDILDLIDDGNEHYLAFTVSALSKIRPFIQGYNFSYGIGDPRENPQQQNLPLILDAGDTFCICLRRVLEVGNVQFDNRQLVVNFHQVQPIRPQPNYQLPPDLFNMITNGDIDCVVCTVNVLTRVNVNFILGFDFCYGTGVPIQNKQNNGPLVVPAGDSFWFCLEPINPPFVFILGL